MYHTVDRPLGDPVKIRAALHATRWQLHDQYDDEPEVPRTYAGAVVKRWTCIGLAAGMLLGFAIAQVA